MSAEAPAKAEAIQSLSIEGFWIASSQELLAITRMGLRACHTLAVIARLDRAIQYSETIEVHREAAAYWIPRLRGE
ncbi:hypothetical protein [Bradyrhizobium sp. RDM4]|uniref:hypothetical protein n=1 Tax=Bradyrhizobium sp. RDM4 TaxID=3378765 RepID=UPI0038FC0659